MKQPPPRFDREELLYVLCVNLYSTPYCFMIKIVLHKCYFVIKSKLFVFFTATTSAMAWLPHGGCAVLVDDPAVISEDSHLGSNPSRGNPQPLHPDSHHPGQTHPGPFQYFLVYEPLQDAVQELQGSGTSPRRMRRSVSHDLPPRMDTHPPDSPTPATDPLPPDPPNNPHPSRTLDSNPLTPDNNPPSSPHHTHLVPSPHQTEQTTNTNFPPPSPQHNHHTDATSHQSLLTPPNTNPGPQMLDSTLTSDNTVVVRPERGPWSTTHNSKIVDPQVPLTNHHSLTPEEGSPINNIAHSRGPLSLHRGSALPARPLSGDTHSKSHVKFLDAKTDSADNVFDPVVDVVEYSNVAFDSEMPEDNVASDDGYDDSDSISNTDYDSSQEYEATDDTEDTEGRQEGDYEFGRSLEEVEGDVVEYEQDTGTVVQDVLPVPNHSQLRLAGPSILLANTVVRNDSLDELPVPLENSDPNVTLSDGAIALEERMMGDAPTDGSGRKVLRSWMGSFPTLPSYNSEVEAAGSKRSIPDVFSGLGHQGPGGASWFSRRPNSEVSPSQNGTTHSLPLQSLGAHSRVDTWFTRYGTDTSNSREHDGEFGGSVRRMTEYERILFSSLEGAAGRSARSAARKRSGASGYRSSYDPRDPNGGAIPHSSPDRYPSRILESMGVPHYQESTKTPEYSDNRDAESSRDSLTARDVFPHIFEYDLNEHDDYYYDDPDYYYFDDFAGANVRPQTDIDDFEDVPDEDEADDVILDDIDDRDDLGPVEAGHRNPDSVVTMSSASHRLPVLAPTSRPISATHYPPDLRALALTREEFHVGVAEPQVKTLSHGDEVVEIEVVPLYPEPVSSSNVETGPNYSPAANRERNTGAERHYEEVYEADTTTRSTTTSRQTPRTPPAAIIISTISPTSSPHHNNHRGSVPLQLAKFMPTRSPEHDARTGQVSEGRKIPKFLKHISDQLSSLTRDSFSTDNIATSHGHQGTGGISHSSSNNNYRVHASQQPSERDFTSTNIEMSSSHGSTGHHHSQASSDDDVEEWTATGDTSSTSQVHPNTRTFNESPRDVRPQESSTPNTGYRFNRSPQHNVDTSPAFPVATNSRHSKRVTVNVTIATDDGSQIPGDTTHVEKPLYVLSVSVPTSGGDQQADITLLEPSAQRPVASVSLPLHGNNTHAGLHQGLERGQAGQCQCPCPCNSESRPYTSSNSIPIPPHFLPDSVGSSPTDQNSHSQGCVLNPNNDPTTTTTTTTPPPPPPWVAEELEGEINQTPHLVVARSGTLN